MEADRSDRKKVRRVAEAAAHYGTDDLPGMVKRLEEEMRVAAKNLDFETAARLRDELFDVRAAMDGTRREPRRAPARR
jgi:excinuclease UvrABC helicase subunit UvrB